MGNPGSGGGLLEEIHTKPQERARLLQFGRPLGMAIKELITIVTPQTFFRWIRESKRKKQPSKTRGTKRQDLRELVLRIAKETGFGYTRILGELRKLGIRKICRQTVKNIIKEHGEDPGPKRGPGGRCRGFFMSSGMSGLPAKRQKATRGCGPALSPVIIRSIGDHIRNALSADMD